MSNKSYKSSLFKRIIDLGVVREADVDDLVRIWRVGSGDEKAITLANFVATVNADLGADGSTLTELIEALELRVDDLDGAGLSYDIDGRLQVNIGAGLSLDSTNRIRLGKTDPFSTDYQYVDLKEFSNNPNFTFVTDWDSYWNTPTENYAVLNIGKNSFGEVNSDLSTYYPSTTEAGNLGLITDSGSPLVRIDIRNNSLLSSGIYIDKLKMLIKDQVNTKGLIYDGDYEANFTARSLVTKQYVDGAVSGAAISIGSPANGLSLAGTVLSLGLASAGVTGALSGADWSTFNNKENAITAGTTAQYWRGDKTFQDFATAVRGSVLTGYTVGANTALADSDTVLSAFGKIQGQINARVSGTIASGQVAFGTGVNTVGGNADLVWNNSAKFLSINGKLTVGTLIQPDTINIYSLGNLSGGTSVIGVLSQNQIQSGVTASAVIFRSSPSTQATTFTLSQITHFLAQPSTFGAGSTVTSQNGFFVASNLTDATNNYAFRSVLNSGTGRWNLYMDGTATNYLAGQLWIGTTSGTNTLDVNGTARIRTISNLGSTATRFLVASATGVISERTGAELAADLGVSPISGLTTNLIPVATSSSTLGNSVITQESTISILYGNRTLSTTATPLKISLGGTVGNNAVGTSGNLKFALFEDGTASNSYGIGMSSALMELRAGATGAIGFFTNNGTEVMRALSNGTLRVGTSFSSSTTFSTQIFNNTLFGDTTTTLLAFPLKISLGGTVGNNAVGNYANMKLVIYESGATSNWYGFGMSTSLMEIRAGSTGAIGFFPNNGVEALRILSTGNLQFADAKDIVFNTTTGTKIATATSQKFAFWNATPIVQPTTGVAAATLVSNAGTTLTSTDTFDGYTLQQIVRALRNTGLLA